MHEVKTSEKVDPLEIYRVVITRSASLPWKAPRDWKRPDPQNRPETPDFRVFRGFPVGPREPPKSQKKCKKKCLGSYAGTFFDQKSEKKGCSLMGCPSRPKKSDLSVRIFLTYFTAFLKNFGKFWKFWKVKIFVVDKKRWRPVKLTKNHFFKPGPKKVVGWFLRKNSRIFRCGALISSRRVRTKKGYQTSHPTIFLAKKPCIAP